MATHTYKNVKPSGSVGPARQTHGFGAAVGGSEVLYKDNKVPLTLKGPKNKLAKGGAVISRGVAKRGFGTEVK
jgi:hypothetical protein